MIFFKHLGQLLKEFGLFALRNKAWWILPVILLLLVIAILVFAGQTVAPFIYTIF